jgi:ABC-2 type transport system permease protein
VRFEAGPLGVLAFILIAAMWCLAYAGFAYAIAVKTGNPAAVQSSFLMFFPFLFLTSSYMPRDQLSGWLDTVAAFNPVTYILEGMRSLVLEGWEWAEIGKALLAIAVVGAISFSLCLAGFRGRIKRG